ncbi:MAG: flippase-like domain-containing protein, partial [Planctomycetaceae bacterium]|nr:flippase-like domain-containing protein [Planctomycetaceae bacterium]
MTESNTSEPAGWRRHWAWAKWLVAATFLALLFRHHRDGLSKMTREMSWQSLDWLSVLTAIALCGGAILLTFLRWFCLVAALRFQFTVRDAMRLGFIGYLFNFVGPGSVGGDLVKAVLLAKEQPDRRTTAVATVLLDRILGLLALFMIGAGAAYWQWDAIRQRAELKAIVGLLAFGSVAGLVGLGLMMIPAVTQSRVWSRLARLPVVGHLIAELVEGV